MIGKTALAWIMLLTGGILQIGWSVGLDYTNSFTDIGWDLVTIVFLFLSMVCLEYPMRLGITFTTAYAVWIGVGVVCTVLVSDLLGLETISVGMALCLAIVIAGVVGLKMTPVEYRE